MTSEELNAFVKQFGISKDQILREEAEMIFLNALAKHVIGSRVVFYGGTALRLAYGSPRFSEDLDLLRIKPFTFREFSAFLKKIIPHYPSWKIADIKEKRNTIFALVVISDEKLKHNFSIKIEIHKPAKGPHVKAQLMLLKSPVSTTESLILVPTLPELQQLKGKAFAQRKKARDIFDLWYIAQSLRQPFRLPMVAAQYTNREFTNELKVFLPRLYYPIINQLYETVHKKD